MSAGSLHSRSKSASGPPLIRLAHPYAFGRFIEQLGGSRSRLFRRAGLPALCEDVNTFVPVKHAWRAFDAAARLEDRDIGWRVGQFAHENNLNGAMLYRIESSATLYRALQEFVHLISCEASDLELGIAELEDEVLLFTHYPDSKPMPGYASSQAYQLPIYLSVIRHYLGPNWVPDEIGIEANLAPEAAKSIFPGARIQTGAKYGYIRIPRHLLLARRRQRPHAPHDSSILLSRRFDYVDRLRAVVAPYLPEGYPSSLKAARLMGTSQRTLARRLAEAGMSYRDIVDEIRFRTSEALLRDTTKDIRQIAEAVGFADQAHFTRMFRRIGGITPSAYRAQLR